MIMLIKLVAIVMIVSAAGCSGTKPVRDKSADVMYKEAMTFFERGDYEDAIAGFQGLNAKYPASQYNIEAKLKIADSYYKDENYPEAISAYREFEKLYPNHEEVAYTIFQTGMSYFKQITTIDRDQTSTVSAAAEFERLLNRFPDSRYADDSGKNLRTARNNLAEKELYIGRFYFRQGNYKAALDRLEGLRNSSPEFGAMDEVLFYLGRTHLESGKNEKGKALLEKLISGYPLSRFTKKAMKILDETRQ